MNEGLTIQLSVQGAQQAFSEFEKLKGTITSMGDSIKALSNVGKVAAIGGLAQVAFDVGSTFANLPSQIRQIAGAFTSASNSGLSWVDIITNLANKESATAQQAINARKMELDAAFKVAQIQLHTQEAHDQFAQKRINTEELFRSISSKNLETLKAELEPLKAKETQLQEKLSKIDSKDLAGESKRQSLELEMIQNRSAQAMVRLKAEAADMSNLASREANRRQDAVNKLQLELATEERLLKIKQDQFNVAQVQVQSSYLLTEVEKRKQLLELYQRERDAIREQIALMEQRKNALDEGDVQGRESVQARIDSAQRRGLGVDQQIAGVQSQADPNSVIQNMQAAITELQNTAGTIAQGIASSFKNAFESAISSVSNGITGLIMGTQTWGQALAQIGNQVLTSLVGAFVQMGVRWIATQILVHTVGKALALAGVAAMAPIAAASAAVWAPAATMATIATFGGAAAAAPELMSAATVAAVGQSVMASFAGAGFERGGYTGDGPRSSPAGIVHRGEYVIPAPVVDRIGVQSLDRLSEGGGGSQNIAFFDDGTKLSDWAKTQDGETIIVDVVRRNMHRL